MGWNVNTDYKVILTDKAQTQTREILDYIFFKLETHRQHVALNRI